MDNEAATAALQAIQDGVNLFRLAITDKDKMPPAFRWAGEAHVDQVIARLGYFEVRNLELELQLGTDACTKRIREAIGRGVAVQVEPRSNYRGAVYRWTGKT